MAGRFKFFEFFAGGGMARAGLGERWDCLFANDFDPMKGETYCVNWGSDHFFLRDVAKFEVCELPGTADLVWASFPCQDLSLAGNYRGMGEAGNLTRSGTFWPFWSLIRGLKADLRKPKMIVLENVAGAISSRNGSDFQSICSAFAECGYSFGAFIGDASEHQERPQVAPITVPSL